MPAGLRSPEEQVIADKFIAAITNSVTDAFDYLDFRLEKLKSAVEDSIDGAIQKLVLPKDLRLRVAHHEAGHAVSAVYKNISFTSVECLFRSNEKHDRLGILNVKELSFDARHHERGTWAEVVMAGLASEAIYLGKLGGFSVEEIRDGSEPDIKHAISLVGSDAVNKVFDECILFAILHENEISAVAESLVEKSVLTESEVRQIMFAKNLENEMLSTKSAKASPSGARMLEVDEQELFDWAIDIHAKETNIEDLMRGMSSEERDALLESAQGLKKIVKELAVKSGCACDINGNCGCPTESAAKYVRVISEVAMDIEASHYNLTHPV